MLTLSEIFHQLQRNASDKPAIQYDERWYSWSWIANRSAEIESALSRMGIGGNDTVGLVPYNRHEFVSALMALIASNRQIVMIYAYLSSTAKAKRIRELNLPAIIAAPEDWNNETLSVCRDAGTFAFALSDSRCDELANNQPTNREPSAPQERGIALLTSGTTGPPKQFHISYKTLQKAILGKAEISPDDLSWLNDSNEPGTPGLHFMPLGNVGGIYTLLPRIIRRNPIILHEKFSLEAWLSYVKKYQPTVMGLPPSAYHMVLEARIPRQDLACIRESPTGAAALDPTVRAEFEQTYDNILITQSYGATEFCGTVTLMTREDRIKFGPACADSVGRPFLGASIKIVDVDTGDILPAGEEGRIMVKTPRVGDEWIETNDLGILDEHEFLYHKGRLDGAIMRGGFKIVPDVVSEVLNRHPSIALSSVVGIKDKRLGEVPVAAFEVRTDHALPTDTELEHYLRQSLPATHIPVSFLRVNQLPRTPSMKIDTAGVKALFLHNG